MDDKRESTPTSRTPRAGDQFLSAAVTITCKRRGCGGGGIDGLHLFVVVVVVVVELHVEVDGGDEEMVVVVMIFE